MDETEEEHTNRKGEGRVEVEMGLVFVKRPSGRILFSRAKMDYFLQLILK